MQLAASLERCPNSRYAITKMSSRIVLRALGVICNQLRVMGDFVRDMGAAAFGTRLRRVSEMLDRQVQAFYQAHGIRFEPRWFPIVSALRGSGVLSVGELAALLGISHAAISRMRGELIAAGLVRAKADPTDGRRQLLELSAAGTRMMQTMDPVWSAIGHATASLLLGTAPRFLEDLAHIEAALKKNSMTLRVESVLKREESARAR
jgi:MarR family transcriptional regulator, organic hydroperoxide resistance regulator